MIALLIPVLLYGVLCALLGFWVRDNVLTHWPTITTDVAQIVRVRLLGGLSSILRVLGRPHASRSEEHTSELQSLMRISYAVFCLKKKTNDKYTTKKDQIHTRTTN